MGNHEAKNNYKRDTFHYDTQLHANLDSLTRHRVANRKRVARSNYGPLDGHKQRKVCSFRKTSMFWGYLAGSRPFRLRGTPPSQGKRFSLPLLAGRATHRRDECLLCQSHEPVWRFPPTTLQELA